MRRWIPVRDRQTCVGCGKKSPETETNYTLISAQFGWRLTRYKSADGTLVVEWRCPTCWREYKRTRPNPPSSDPMVRAPSSSAKPSSRPSSPPLRPATAPLPPLPPLKATDGTHTRPPLPPRAPTQPTTLPSTPAAAPTTGRPRPPR